jgi:hypothetical protein
MPRSAVLTALAVLIGIGITGVSGRASEEASGEDTAAKPPYTVECEVDAESGQVCYVDRDTYVGWRTFHGFCHVCHAQDAVGSTFAPNLLERMRVIDKTRFVDVLDNGFTGQVGVMPAWKNNPNVTKHYDALYAYLKARADDVLPPGRPQRRRE